MGFVTPMLAVIGVVLMAIPIIIHWLNRRRYKVVEWAAMRYLLAAIRQNRRRLRFESWLLLVLRCLVLGLLAAAMARPLGCSSQSVVLAGADRAGLHVIILDDSLSMSYEAKRPGAITQLDRAKQLARQQIDTLEGSQQRIAIISASKPARIIMQGSFDLEAARSAISDANQTYQGNDVAGALTLADEIIRSAGDVPNRVVWLYTDRTAASLHQSDTEQLTKAARSLAERAMVSVVDLSVNQPSNRAIVSTGSTDQLVRIGFGTDLRAGIVAFGQNDPSTISFFVDDKSIGSPITTSPSADETTVLLPQIGLDKPGPTLITARFTQRDHLPIDDELSTVLDVAGHLKLLIVEGRSGNGPLDGSGSFLKLALAPPDESTNKSNYIAPEVISDADLPGKPISDYRAIVLAGVGVMSEETARQLHRYVEEGGALIIFMGEPVSGHNYNQTLGRAKLLPGELVTRVNLPSTETGATFDFDSRAPHPVLSAFKNYQRSGLDSAQIFSYWRMTIDPSKSIERVLDFKKLPDQTESDPAITLERIGLGRVIVVATSADAEWSTLVARPAYVTLVHELVGGAIGSESGWMNRQVGQRIEIPSSLALTIQPALKSPANKLLPLTRSETGAWQSDPIELPGIYSVEVGDQRWPVVVNVSSNESDVRLIDRDGFRQSLGDIELNWQDESRAVGSGTSKSIADYAWPVMLLVLPMMLAETILARWFGRNRR